MNRLPQKQATQIRYLVLFTGLLTTLMIWTSLADPINVPKMFILVIFASWIFGSVITGLLSTSTRRLRFSLGQWAVCSFVLGLLIAALLTDVKYTAFFGALQRNDGVFSYLALASLSFAAMVSFSSSDIRQVRIWLLVIGLVLTIHGLLQTFGHDPIKWVLLYNPVIGTLGNPDFFSGIIAATALASVWIIFAEKRRWVQGTGLVLLLLELFLLKRCGSMQGIAAFGVGLAILSIVKIWHVQRRLGIAASIVVGISFILVIFGFLNKGPLASHLYRGSIQSRIDYWHAALRMFKTHPLAGIGIDRFGENYGQYAPQIQVVQGQPTDNAHNVFLQLMATGGLLVILPYLFLLSVIFISAVRTIRKTTGQIQLDVVAIFAIWFALLLISSISIDNLGVAVWFWIAGGVLYGVTRDQLAEEGKPKEKQKLARSAKRTSPNELSILSPIVSMVLSVLMLLVILPAWKSSARLFELQHYSGGGGQAQLANEIERVANAQPNNIQIRIALANIALGNSAFDLGIKFIKSINEEDPRSINGNTLGAIAYELTKKYGSAVPYRLRLLQIDPWNRPNMLQLVTDYVALKDLAKAREIALRLSNLYPKSADALAAATLVKG